MIMANKKVTISLPEDLIKQAKELTEEKGYTFSGMIRVGLKNILEK